MTNGYWYNVLDGSWQENGILPSFLSALHPWVSLGLLNNQSPFLSLSLLHLLHPLLYPHCPQVCYNIVHPSRTRSSFSLFIHLPSWTTRSFSSKIPQSLLLHSLTYIALLLDCSLPLTVFLFKSLSLHNPSFLMFSIPKCLTCIYNKQ